MKKITLLVAGLLALTLQANAGLNKQSAARGGGSADTGGGNAVGNQLLDFVEMEGATPISVTSLKPYRQTLVPMLNRIDAKLPGFSKKALGGMAKKQWYMNDKPLSENCINSSMVQAAKEPVACQSKMEGQLYQPWFNNKDVTEKTKAALLLHEMFRGVALETGELSDEDIAYLTRAFSNVANFSDEQLADLWEKMGFRRPTTKTDVAVAKNIYRKIYADHCAQTIPGSAYEIFSDISKVLQSTFVINGQVKDELYPVSRELGSLAMSTLGNSEAYNKKACAILQNAADVK